MKNKQDQRGIALVIEIILVLLVLGVAGFIGYRVYLANQKPTDSSQANTTTAQEQAWQSGDFAVKGTYADADVVKINDTTWRLYYATQPEVQGNNFEIYSATSADGKTWTPDPGTRKTMATFPEVIKLADGRYRMYFQSAGVIKSAISTDGLSFTDEPGTRIDKTNSDNLAFDNVAAPTITQLNDSTFVLIYRGTINTRYAANTPNPTTQLLLWATSTDGLTFTKKGIAVDSRNSTLNGQLDGPDITKWDDGAYRVFVTTYTGVYDFSFDGASSFGTPGLAFAGEASQDTQGFHGAPPGDPTVAKIDGTWFMYYGNTGSESGIHYATLK